MSAELPPQIQNQVAQLQQLQQQAQALAVQRSQLELALNEAKQTLAELDKLDEKAVIFKTVGTILVRSNKDQVNGELTEKKETLRSTFEEPRKAGRARPDAFPAAATAAPKSARRRSRTTGRMIP